MVFEVGKLLRQVLILWLINVLLEGAGTIPERQFALGVFGQKQVKDVAAAERRAGTADEEDELPVIVDHKRLAIGT